MPGMMGIFAETAKETVRRAAAPLAISAALFGCATPPPLPALADLPQGSLESITTERGGVKVSFATDTLMDPQGAVEMTVHQLILRTPAHAPPSQPTTCYPEPASAKELGSGKCYFATSVTLIAPNGKSVHAAILKFDPFMDIAVGQITEPMDGLDMTGLLTAQPVRTEPLKEGEIISTTGVPHYPVLDREGNPVKDKDGKNRVVAGVFTVDSGIVTGPPEDLQNFKMHLPYDQIVKTDPKCKFPANGNSYPGNSGGPTLDQQGRVVGMLNDGYAPQDTIYYSPTHKFYATPLSVMVQAYKETFPDRAAAIKNAPAPESLASCQLRLQPVRPEGVVFPYMEPAPIEWHKK